MENLPATAAVDVKSTIRLLIKRIALDLTCPDYEVTHDTITLLKYIEDYLAELRALYAGLYGMGPDGLRGIAIEMVADNKILREALGKSNDR